MWLVGMMGAGKSAVGPALAQRLECDFVDSDAEIEREAGCSIAELFAAEGEPCFRERERAAIEKLAGRPAVVALGGGAPAQPGAGEWLAATGCVVYLRARPETLVRDGQTLVLGGIYVVDKSTRQSRVPYLHQIPLLGALFRSHEYSDGRKELLVFVTPRIVVVSDGAS